MGYSRRSALLLSSALSGLVLLSMVGPAFSAEQTYKFDIPAESLGQALTDFSKASSQQIVFSEDVTNGKTVAGLHGQYTAQDALKTLLNGTGLVTETNSSGVMMVRSKNVQAARNEGAAQPIKATVESVVVTAEKRVENLSSVPMNISVVSGDTIARRNLTDVQSLSLSVPGLMAYDQGGGHLDISVRGIDSPYGTSPLTGIYVDDIPLSGVVDFEPSYLDFRSYDVQRVEVLKGPQGTLFGEGAVGGVVRYVTNKPDLSSEGGSISATFLGTQEGAPSEQAVGVFNLPVVNNEFALRVAGTYENNGGWITNVGTGKTNINSNQLVDIRAQALWQPIADLSIDALINIHRNQGPASNLVNVAPFSASQFIQAYNTSIPTGFKDAFEIYNLNANYDLGFANLLSSTSYWLQGDNFTYTEYVQGTPPPGNTFPLFALVLPNMHSAQHSFSQEVRLTSQDDGGPVKWLLGGNYTDASASEFFPASGYFASFLYGKSGSVGGDAGDAGITSTKSYALFGDGSYTLFDRLELGGGLRYYNDNRDQINIFPNLPNFSPSKTFSRLTYRAYARLAVTDNINVYANVATGFRSGGFNNQNSIAAGGPGTYQPENVMTEEVGAKTNFLSNRVQLDLAAFTGEYQNQVQNAFIINPTTGKSVTFQYNAGNAGLRGLEWSLTVYPIENLRLVASGDVYTSKFGLVSPIATVSYGDPLNFAPDATLQFSGTYDFHWTDDIPGSIDIAYNYRGKEYYIDRGSSVVLPVNTSSSLSFLQASVGADWQGMHFELLGQNLLNELNPLNATNVGFYNQARPRTFGIRAQKSF